MTPLLLSAVVLAFMPASAAGRPGDLDPSFSTDGLSQLAIDRHLAPGLSFSGPQVEPVGFEPGGDVIVAGSTLYQSGCSHIGCINEKRYLAMARVQPDGALDPAFASGGIFEGDLGLSAMNPRAFAVQGDGRILAVVRAGPDPTVARFTEDGQLDASFSDDGMVTIDLPDRHVIEAITVQDGGRILLGGRIDGVKLGYEFWDQDFLLVRLLDDGRLDSDFGEGGVQTANFSLDDEVTEIAIDGEGRIVVAGRAGAYSPYSRDLAVARFQPDGRLDATFSGDGHAAIDLLPDQSSNEQVLGFGLDSQNRPVMLAQAFPEATSPTTQYSSTALVRFTASGELDPTLNPDGVRYLGDVPQFGISSLSVQADGKMVLGGGFGRMLLLGRRLANGEPDPGFGRAGWVRDYPLTGADGGAVLLAPDGRIVFGGATFELRRRAQLARFRIDSNPPADADADGDLDPGDRCPGVYAPGSGCPSYWRHVKLKRRRDSIGGKLVSESSHCLPTSVLVFRKRPGPDVRIDRTRFDDSELHQPFQSPARTSWVESRPRRGGRLYARVKPHFDPTIGRCGGDRSRTVLVPPR